jgi:hypothetical protein
MGIAKLQHFFFYSFSALFLAIALCLMPPFADGLRRIATILVPLDCYRSRGKMQAAIRLGKNDGIAGCGSECGWSSCRGGDSSFHSLDLAVSTSS